MNNGGEAADQMVREALQFSEVAIKLTALGFKNSLAIALAYAKENPKVRGKTSLDRLLREGKEMKIIPLQTKDLAQFKRMPNSTVCCLRPLRTRAHRARKSTLCLRQKMYPSSTAFMSSLDIPYPRRFRLTEKTQKPPPDARSDADAREDDGGY